MRQSKGLRQDIMTTKERWDAILSGQRPDHIPFMFFMARGFAAHNVGFSVADMYRDAERNFWAQARTFEQYGADGFPMVGFSTYGAWEFGGEIKYPESEFAQAPIVVRPPVETEDDVWKLELPDVKTAGTIPFFMRCAQLQMEFGMFPITPFVGSPFTRTGNLCGLEKLLRWMMKKPELAHRLLRLMTNHQIEVTQYWVDTFGPEYIIPYIGTPSEASQVISPKQLQEFSLPYFTELVEKMLAMGIKHIFCHFCGEQNAHLPYWAKLPLGDPGIVSFGHEVDLEDAIRYFGDKNIIFGNIEPAIIQTGTPQQVYDLCRIAIEKARHAPRGFILSQGCECPPGAPPYNVYMMRKAIDDFGWSNSE